MSDATGLAELDTIRRLQRLGDDYAAAVDGQDAAALREVFTEDALLVAYADPEGEVERMSFSGHDEISRIIERMKAYDATFHLLGNRRYDLDGRTAVGDLYCEAHHRTLGDDGGTDLVMYIKYHDEYRLCADDRWRIEVRRLYSEWMDLRPCEVPEPDAVES